MNKAITTDAMANAYVSLCRQGKFEEAIDRFFSTDHVRIESVNMIDPPAEIRGIDAVKGNAWASNGNTEIHGADIDGPYMGENRFAVRFAIDTTFKPTGERTTITKMDLYTVEGGRIVRDEVYYHTPPSPSTG